MAGTAVFLCGVPRCGAGEERIDGRVKADMVDAKLSHDRLGGKPAVEKPAEELSVKRLQRSRAGDGEPATGSTRQEGLSGREMKTRRVISAQL